MLNVIVCLNLVRSLILCFY